MTDKQTIVILIIIIVLLLYLLLSKDNANVADHLDKFYKEE